MRTAVYLPVMGLQRLVLLLVVVPVSTVLIQVRCMPSSWGANALLHPAHKPVKVPRPPGSEDVTIEGDGVRLKGWFFKGRDPSRGTVIYQHGSADNRASGVSIAQRFVDRGFDALIYDSRAHGQSEGAACTYGYYEKKDLSRVIDWLPHKRVVLLGVSLGAAVALQAAADDSRIATVIAVATFCDLRTVGTERAPFFATKGEIRSAFRLAEEQGKFKVDEVSPVLAAARIRAPVFLIHGQVDKDTPPSHSERVYAALAGPKRLLLVPGAGHKDALRAGVWEQIDSWIDGIVPKVEPAPGASLYLPGRSNVMVPSTRTFLYTSTQAL